MNIPRKRRYPMRPKPTKYSDRITIKVNVGRSPDEIAAAVMEMMKRRRRGDA